MCVRLPQPAQAGKSDGSLMQTIKRITGAHLQARRLRIWAASPHCAMCSKLVAYPRGFELDHIQALKANGGKGADVDVNCQVLCHPCHAVKTAKDMGYKGVRPARVTFDASGRVVW